MNPLRKRFFGDTETAQRYTGEAMGLLDAVHEQMRLGGNDQLQMHKTLGNGVEIFAASRFGQDEIRVSAKSRGGAGGGGAREYCVWEGDDELFSEPAEFYSCAGPTSVDKDTFYMGGSTHPGKGSGGSRIPFAHGGKSFKSSDMSLISAVSLPRLDTRGSGEIGGLTNEDDAFVLVADDVTKTASRHAASGFPYYPLLLSDPMHGAWLGFTNTDSSIYKIFAAGAEAGTVSRDGIPGAVHGGNGDIYAYGPNGIERFGLTTGISETYPLPPLEPDTTFFIAAVKSGDIWLAASASVGEVWQVFNFSLNSGNWVELIAPDGFGVGTSALAGVGYAMKYSPLHYDRITDAVCMVKATSTSGNVNIEGAWIFNGTDCFFKQMPPFFRKFKSAQIPPNIYGNGAQCFACVAQFYNARIYLNFAQGLGVIPDYPLSGPGSGNSLHTAASYKVGRLLQKKQTNVE